MSRLCVTDYEISPKMGFIVEDPLTKLPPYFDAWNDICSRLRDLVASRALRDEIQKMPVLDADRLNGVKEIRLAHCQLAFMTTSYLAGNGLGPKEIPRTLPKGLAVPLHQLHQKHDLSIGVSYIDIVLSNTTLKNAEGPVELDNITAIVHPTSGEDWDWFFAVSGLVEYTFWPAIQAMQDVLDGVDDGDEKKIGKALDQIAQAVLNMKDALKRFNEKLSVEAFFPKMTRFFTGYEQMNPEGIVFEGVRDEPFKSPSANAGQSPSFKALDILLGIHHAPDRHAYTEKLIETLLPKHKQFIRELEKRPKKLKDVVMASNNTDLKASYNNAVQAIITFRTSHVQIVTRYVVQGINKNVPQEMHEQFAPVKDFVVQYVKGMRDDSKQAMV